MAMTDEQIERYSRHIILNEVGVKGQKKLLKGKVLIIGAGGLGAPAAMYLAAAGVGTIGIVDADYRGEIIVPLINLAELPLPVGMIASHIKFGIIVILLILEYHTISLLTSSRTLQHTG